MLPMIEMPLDLQEVTVLKTKLIGREIIITVESTCNWAICPACEHKTYEFYGEGRTLRLRHLLILGRRAFIELNPKRFKCRHCKDKIMTQQLDWYVEGAPHTKAYDQSPML